MSARVGYQDSLRTKEATILNGQTLSGNIDCLLTSTSGETVNGRMCLVRIDTPANWVTSSVLIKVFKDNTFTNGKTATTGDGQDVVVITLAQVAANQGFMVPPYWTFPVTYLKIESVTPQSNGDVTLDLFFQPIAQVNN